MEFHYNVDTMNSETSAWTESLTENNFDFWKLIYDHERATADAIPARYEITRPTKTE